MKRLLISGLIFGFSFAAFAQVSQTTQLMSNIAKTDSDTKLSTDDADKTLNDRNCLRQTGSRITAHYNTRAAKDKQQCAPIAGRSYTNEDIQRTGAIDLADALRSLDPAIR